MLVGQALATANLCAKCGGPLSYDVATGLPCALPHPEQRCGHPNGHYHEREPLVGSGLLPTCCKCLREGGATCSQLEVEL